MMNSNLKNLLFFPFIFFFLAYTSQIDVKQETVYSDISPAQAKEKIDNGKNVLILDVRTREEFLEGHIKGAVNIPVNEVEKRLDELKKYKNSEIIVYCRSGRRSKIASEILVKNGFKRVYNLSGGIIEWKKEIGKK